MQTSNANQSVNPHNSEWYFLAEYSLSEFLADLNIQNKLTAGLLFQTVQELVIPPEYVEDMETMLKEFAKEALGHFKQERLELPGRIRIFCQKKVIDNANTAKISKSYNTEQTPEHSKTARLPAKRSSGGWGYFLIERRDNMSTGSSVISWNSVELYLYKEGE